MDELMGLLETYIDARIEQHVEGEQHHAPAANEARGKFAECLGKLLRHAPAPEPHTTVDERVEAGLPQSEGVYLWRVPVGSWVRAEYRGQDAEGRHQFYMPEYGMQPLNGDVAIKEIQEEAPSVRDSA